MEIEDTLRRFIRENFYLGTEVLEDDDSLMERGVVDSTGMLELIGFLEERFGLSVEDEEVVPENLDSVERLAIYVRRKLAARQVAG